MTRRGVALDLEALRKELQVARENEKPNHIPSLRDAVGVLLPEIEALRRDKWTDVQIAEWLGKRSLVISPGTLAQYVREARRATAATDGDMKARRPAKVVANDAPGVATNAERAKPVPKSEAGPKVAKAVTATPTDTETEARSAPPVTRTPNAAAAIPAGKRRVQDDA